MKKLLLIAILTLTYSCRAQNKPGSDSVSELPNVIFQRWKLDYGMANGQKISGLPQSPNNDLVLKQNGEYLNYNEDGTFFTGKWEYNSDEKIIYTKSDDGRLNGIIADIKAKSITLVPAGKAVEGTPFENFRFYYIPKGE
ncbi:hypothetical protein GCM10007103_00020 [Salinimicrobium marinum]|uniref:Lipocalin-like domain-containing protein n=1 Tax=Salinimicrobium marinum TaxID=680283 RepID=A0A918VTU5_9FLAO|nr:hypothetical protein [Salinimicrobium marinum]GHA22960.1 hypothetical protein GCM10007103_00020 [Salinimicrobium marinum]